MAVDSWSAATRWTAMETWEQIVVLILAAGLLVLMFPRVKEMLARSEQAEKDWPAVLVPLGLVVLFVILLISLA
jgi:hypothetical protein